MFENVFVMVIEMLLLLLFHHHRHHLLVMLIVVQIFLVCVCLFSYYFLLKKTFQMKLLSAARTAATCAMSKLRKMFKRVKKNVQARKSPCTKRYQAVCINKRLWFRLA